MLSKQSKRFSNKDLIHEKPADREERSSFKDWEKTPKMQVYTRFDDKTNDSMMVSFIKSPERFCEGIILNVKKPTNKRQKL